MKRCGQCRQFIRKPENQRDLCGAWEQPTSAVREACDFFAPLKPLRNNGDEQPQG